MGDLEQEVLARIERQRKLKPKMRSERITMSHGAGGKATQTLIESLFLPAFAQGAEAPLTDAATVTAGDSTLAFSTDSFVVKPLRFPGGSIGELAVNGTVNDLAVSGARPLALSAAFIIEEGLSTDDLRTEAEAMAAAASAAGVRLVTGDTKVVERGKCDGLYITTAGIGISDTRCTLDPRSLRPGDVVICSGTIGDHGMAIMIARGELALDADISSDTAPLWTQAEAIISSAGDGLRVMRDPTRGGVATVLNELARDSEVGIVVSEEAFPVRPEVAAACEILGIDPMYVANEGKLLAVVAPACADATLDALKSAGAPDAVVIGRVAESPPGMVLVETSFGGTRIMDMLIGDPLPRIC